MGCLAHTRHLAHPRVGFFNYCAISAQLTRGLNLGIDKL